MTHRQGKITAAPALPGAVTHSTKDREKKVGKKMASASKCGDTRPGRKGRVKRWPALPSAATHSQGKRGW